MNRAAAILWRVKHPLSHREPTPDLREVFPRRLIRPWPINTKACPSSDDLRHIAGLQKGGSGSSVIKIMRHAGGAASDGLRLSGA